MPRNVLATVAFAALLGSASPALGQGKPVPPDLKMQKHLIEVGLTLGAFFPSGRHELYNDTDHKKLQLGAFDLGLRFAYLPVPNLGIELEAALIPTKTRGGESALLYALNAHAIVQFPLARRFAPFVVLGGGGLGVRSSAAALGNDHDSAFHYGAGLKVYVTEWLSVRVDFRHIVSARNVDQDITSHFEALVGASWVVGWKNPPPIVDTDGDGVPDDKDKCPTAAAKTPTGCPPDKDGDGVPDATDKCPDVAAMAPDGCPPDKDGDGVPDEKDECPDVAAKTPNGCVVDRDHDGVNDDVDRCPDVAAKTPDGCPLDTDGDGVPDSVDKCPEVTARTKDGCPVDTDGDGVPDSADKCPLNRETKNGYQDGDGCQDEVPKELARLLGVVKGIAFGRGKAALSYGGRRWLDKAAKVLARYPDTRIAIRAHTENVGKREENLKLSLERAQAVKEHLVKRGVEASRLKALGLGPDEPAPKPRRGRPRNERVELQLVVGK